jgi:hypothetical protein
MQRSLAAAVLVDCLRLCFMPQDEPQGLDVVAADGLVYAVVSPTLVDSLKCQRQEGQRIPTDGSLDVIT